MKHIIVCSLVFLIAMAGSAQALSPRQDVIKGPLQGEVLEVLDGDTVTVRLHVWIGQDIQTHVRISGIDAPEIKGKCAYERGKAQQARNEMISLLPDGKITLSNIRLEKYAGRVLAEAQSTKGVKVADHMIDKGLARPYAGAKRAGWCSAAAN